MLLYQVAVCWRDDARKPLAHRCGAQRKQLASGGLVTHADRWLHYIAGVMRKPLVSWSLAAGCQTTAAKGHNTLDRLEWGSADFWQAPLVAATGSAPAAVPFCQIATTIARSAIRECGALGVEGGAASERVRNLGRRLTSECVALVASLSASVAARPAAGFDL